MCDVENAFLSIDRYKNAFIRNYSLIMFVSKFLFEQKLEIETSQDLGVVNLILILIWSKFLDIYTKQLVGLLNKTLHSRNKKKPFKQPSSFFYQV